MAESSEVANQRLVINKTNFSYWEDISDGRKFRSCKDQGV